MIEERVVLETNEQGYPILLPVPGLKIELSISIDSETGITDFEIIGDSASLVRLGEVLIGVGKSKGYHVHMESNSESSAVELEPAKTRLTVSNSELPEAKQSPDCLPPDWARG